MSEEAKEIARKYFTDISKIEKEFEEKDKEIERLNKCIKDDKENANEIMAEQQQEIERLNNIINKGIEAINVYQNEKTLSVGYQDLKRIRGILQGNEFDLQMFEEYLQELKGEKKCSINV